MTLMPRSDRKAVSGPRGWVDFPLTRPPSDLYIRTSPWYKYSKFYLYQGEVLMYKSDDRI